MKYMEGFDVDMTYCPAVAQTIANSILQWKPLGRYLGLDEATIMKIERDNLHDYNEQKYQCIYHWSQRIGANSKIIHLLRIIYYKLEDKILLENIVQSLGQMGINTLVVRNLHNSVFVYKGAEKEKMHTAATEFNETDFTKYLEDVNVDHDIPCHPVMFQSISLCLVQWKPLARYFGMNEATIVRIERENSKDYNGQKYQCVCHLFQNNGTDAAIMSLLKVIYYKLKDKTLLQNVLHSLCKKYLAATLYMCKYVSIYCTDKNKERFAVRINEPSTSTKYALVCC